MFTSGENLLVYTGDPRTPTISIIDTKIHINSVISDADKGAKYMCMDIKNYNLGSAMNQVHYMRIHMKHIPPEITREYNITFDKQKYAYVKIQ